MASILKAALALFQRKPWPPLQFPTTGFEVIAVEYILEEERSSHYNKNLYYPVNIGQVVGKLGYGVSSTAWLARDVPSRHVHGTSGGRRSLVLVQKPVADSLDDLRNHGVGGRFTPELLRLTLLYISNALDYLHSECKIVHTGQFTQPLPQPVLTELNIKLDNIFVKTRDDSIFDEFVQDEMKHPICPKIDPTPVYGSRGFRYPSKSGPVVLGYFGSAIRGDEEQVHPIQPNQFRSPEVLFNRSWSYPVDIWNVGVMAWEMLEGKCLFRGLHPDGSGYHPQAHITKVIAALGPPLVDWLFEDPRSKAYFDPEGQWIGEIPIPANRTMEDREELLTGVERDQFLAFIRCMLQWRPDDRMTATQLLDYPWLKASKSMEPLVPRVQK